MSALDNHRQPPRFVPTLTDVVADQQSVVGATVPNPESDAFPLPVLPLETAIVEDVQEHDAKRRVADSPIQSLTAEPDWAVIAHELQSKVMTRLDGDLEERLRYALVDVVQLHTQALYQALRQDVQSLVSEAVHEAVAQELAQLRKATKT